MSPKGRMITAQTRLNHCLATVMGTPPEKTTVPQLVTRHSLREKGALSGARVLLAEDNEINQRVAVRMLESVGLRVDVASDGREALDALSKTNYAAVLMDVQMPNLDGYEATMELRRREGQEHHTPVIAMTANTMTGDREKALDAGMDDYISKPISFEDLGEVLNEWIVHREPTASDGSEFPESRSIHNREDTWADPLDRATLERLRRLEKHEPGIVGELVELFLNETPSRLNDLQRTLEQGEARTLERIAHTLKGSAGNMGAWQMSMTCAELQEIGASKTLEKAPKLLDRLASEFERVALALTAQTERS